MKNLRFDRKLLLAFAIQAGVVICALIVAVSSLRAASDSFGHLLQREVAHEVAVAEMYAQGLQQGQALRNIVLDPANERGHKNLAQAQSDYQEALAAARASTSQLGQLATLSAIDELGPKRAEAIAKVVAVAKTDMMAAAALMNSLETPLWRELKDKILEAQKAASAASAEVGRREVASAERATLIATALAALAALAALVLVLWLRRTVNAELGGDPAEVRDVLRQIADGNLQQTIVVPAGAEASLVAAIGQMQTGLNTTLASVRHAVESISTASGEIAVGNQDLSSRTEAQAANLQETAAAMDELTSTVASSASAAQQANQLAAAASGVAGRGGVVVGQVVSTMDEISAASRQIADIIGVIDGIAFQTNILALNAAVEAARAGEQGRGFAVVAGEVRSLAQRSAQAAKEIKSLIEDSTQKVGMGASQVQEAGRTMDDIVAQVKRVTDLMAEITAGTQEQSAGISQVNQAVATLDQMTQQNAALVEQSAAAASSLKDQALALDAAVARFKLRGAGASSSARPKAPAAAVRSSKPEVKAPVKAVPAAPAAQPAAAGGVGEWTEF